MPTGEFWEDWFRQAYRSLKYGGHCVMFGLDRQLLLFKYYAALAGFTEKQSMYWFFISSFPKSADLSKNIDKNKGAEREVVSKRNDGIGSDSGSEIYQMNDGNSKMKTEINETAPATDLAKKYDGYKYSISPLKQTNETIMIFQKPYKTGSCLHDTLKMEEGDEECTCGAVDVERNRVGLEYIEKGRGGREAPQFFGRYNNGEIYEGKDAKDGVNQGRYPSQAYCNSQAAEALDKQSGVSKTKRTLKAKAGTDKFNGLSYNNGEIYSNKQDQYGGYDDVAGCSKILHKCDFEKEEHDLYHYIPKVGKKERNAGCEEMKEKEKRMMDGGEFYNGGFTKSEKVTNNHPTLKPIALTEKILKLFKTPNKQRILIPFAGSGSEIIGAIKVGFEDIEGCEINEEYCQIAEARIKYWKKEKESKLL